MLAGGGEHQDRRGVRPGGHLLDAAEVQAGREVHLRSVGVEQRLVGFHDAHQFGVWPVEQAAGRHQRSAAQKTAHVTMGKPDDPEPERWGRGLCHGDTMTQDDEKEQGQANGCFHGAL